MAQSEVYRVFACLIAKVAFIWKKVAFDEKSSCSLYAYADNKGIIVQKN